MIWNAEEIRQLRYRLGWSKAEFARCLKVDTENLIAWESGLFAPQDEHRGVLQSFFRQVEAYAEKIQRRPIAEALMRDRGLSQIHDLEIVEAMTP